MNRDEFTGMPSSLALGLLWDHSAGMRNALANVEAPKRARPPKFDSVIYKKDGITYASEYDAEGLRYWHDRYAHNTNPEYAEKDAKRAKALTFWIEWREQNPTAIWTGERNHAVVTAAAPSGKPPVYPREPRTEPSRTAGGGFSDADYGSPEDDATEGW